ncbi:GTP 3',8-cyclase MoaA [Pradoshia sp.]|uniref:GTP 3',8-cyclase MoaA n=1 Tax=Pradoshia sp. TaxID=2651281 RepID=UPI003F0534EE
MNNEQITDMLDRPLRDLRISVIDRCNLRCQYCMPADQEYTFLPKEELLTFEEIERTASVFAELGVKKIRLTGGEPLLRRDLPVLVNMLSSIKGIEDIALTTNGILLPKQAKALKEAGVNRVNISLDSINESLFKLINGRGIGTKPVVDGIRAAKEAGFETKVNMVVKKGMNDDQIIPMAEFCREEGVQLRYIEFMDVGTTNDWKMDEVITKKDIFVLLNERFELEPLDPDYFGEVAKKYRYKDTNTLVGFITSVSESFCGSCTRARLSANGHVYTCLFSEAGHDIRDLLRSSSENELLRERIVSIWNHRHDRYSDQRTEAASKLRKKIEMSYIGG